LTETETKEKAVPEPSTTTRLDQESIIGSMVDGRYLVKKILGQGGFGMVYLASDEKMMSRQVVLKALHEGERGNEWSVKKFQQEMEALARVDHPSIVGIFDVGHMADGKPYIVMQYVDGCNLRSLITPEGMNFWRAGNIIRQMGRALSSAHERGILHRDLKPENIMIQKLGDGEEQVKVIDFGIAKVRNSVVSATTAHDRAVGTIAYMSPEQLSAGPVSPASDVYCFAVIAYEMLTGRRPANPESAYQLLEMQRSGVRVNPVDLRPALPGEAQKILLKALSFDPKDRYQRAIDFADLLSSVLIKDDEQTVLQTRPEKLTSIVEHQTAVHAPETAHVLFMDIVGYSKMLMDEQPACLEILQDIVGKTDDFCRAQRAKQLIRLPTGDGLALVFFGDPEAPVRCALDISRELKNCPDMGMRMGIHSGLVYRMADINTNMNVAGGGINIAQRVMDCGDAGHILISKRVADDLLQLRRWSDMLHDLGEAEVKHGFRVHLYNLFSDEVGNQQSPAKLRPAPKPFPVKRANVIRAAVLGLALLVGVGLLILNRQLRPFRAISPAGPAAEVPAREQSLAYWLTVQKMYNQKPLGEPIESTGDQLFGNGWKFRFNVQPDQNGALYLLNEGPAADNKNEYNVLFPNPMDNQGVAGLNANQRLQAGWYRFVEHTGVEKLWLIWSANQVPELDEVFRDAAKHEGVITNAAQVGIIQNYLKRYESQRPEVVSNKSLKRTQLKGKGDIVVSLIELSHEAY
jgi:serine/threonine protein kinase